LIKEESSEEDSLDDSQQKESIPSWWGRATKSLVTKVVVSKLGKRIIRDWVSPDGFAFLGIMRGIVRKKSNSEVVAELFEQLALRTFTDVILMITNKSLPKERVLLTRDPLFQLWSDALDMMEISFVFDELRLVSACASAWFNISSIILPGVGIEKQDQLDNYINLLSDKDFLIEFYTTDLWITERDQLKIILRRVWDTTFTRTQVI